MIKELSYLGKSLRTKNAEDKIIHNALKEEPVSIDLVLKKDGSFHSFVPFERKMTTAEAITAKKGKARLLLDKAEEVLGYGGKSSEKKHELFLEKLEIYKNVNVIAPVLAFYGKNKENGVGKAINEFEKAIPEKERKGNIAFRIFSAEKRIHEELSVIENIIKNYDKAESALLVESKNICSICGENDYPVLDIPHGMIRMVPDGQPSGCALVSYNEDAFESYGLSGNENSSICSNCSRTYVEGLKWLLSDGNRLIIKNKKGKEKEIFKYTHRKKLGADTALIFWTRENVDIKEIDLLEAPDDDKVANLIDSVASGDIRNSMYLESDQFYACTLSGASARIAVRDWIQTSLTEFQRAITQWFKDIAISYYDYDLKKIKIKYSRLYELAKSFQRKNSDGKYDDSDTTSSRAATYLWNAALKNTSPPMWLLTAVLKRARLDGLTPERAAFIKLILNRKNKGGGFMINECLKEGKKPVAYICGQIFAVLESVQRAALGKNINAGIRERYFSFALTTPSAAFGRLFNMNSKHFTKLKGEKPGLAVVLDKEMQNLCKDIDIEEFPATFSLEEQGQFAIGYYHQKQAQFSHSELKETLKEE